MFFYKVLGLLLLPAILLYFYLYMNDEVIPFDCSSEFHVYHEDNGKNEIDVFSSVKINFHIPSNDKGIIQNTELLIMKRVDISSIESLRYLSFARKRTAMS
nr:Sea18 [Serratia proteamaculans]